MSENLLQKLMETNLIKSLKPILDPLDYFQHILLISDSGRLMWSLEG
jgi:uncharacterized protein YpbB